MSKKKKDLQTKPNTPTVEVSSNTDSSYKSAPAQQELSSALAFGKSNFTFMLIGLGVIVLGYFLMTLDKEEFGFGFMGLTLGPIVVFLGFMIEIYAILKKKA